MAKQKIADFTANLDFIVKNIKNLDRVESSLANLPKKIKKIKEANRHLHWSMEAGKKQLAHQARYQKEIVKFQQAALKNTLRANRLNRQSSGFNRLSKSWTEAAERTRRYREANNDPRRIADVRKRVQRAIARNTPGGPSGFARWSQGVAGLEYAAKQKQAEVLERMQQRFNRAERRREADKNREADAARRRQIQDENRRHQITMQNLRREAAAMRNRILENRYLSGGSSGGGTRVFGRTVGRPATGGLLGGAVGGLSGGFTGLVGGVAAGYGLGALNRANQEIIGAELTTQAVMEANGLTAADGPKAFHWLKNQAERLGFSYMDSAQDYNSFLANSMGAGNSLETAQDIFKGFSEYGRAMHLTPYRTKLVMNALSQMQGKGTVSMEELRRQMAESMPGTMGIFASAYQELLGGNLTGQQAIAKLIEDVSNGRVNSSAILPLVARRMSETAAPSLDKASKTSQAEQARAVNARNDAIKAFSSAGFEPAMARVFKSLAKFLKENIKFIETLGRVTERLSVGFANLLEMITNLVNAFYKFGDIMKISREDMTILAGIALILATGFGRAAAALFLVFMVIEDIALGLQGYDSYTRDFLEFLEDNRWAKIATQATATAVAIGLIASAISKVSLALGAAAGVAGKGGIIGTLLRLVLAHPYIAAVVALGSTLYAVANSGAENAKTNPELAYGGVGFMDPEAEQSRASKYNSYIRRGLSHEVAAAMANTGASEFLVNTRSDGELYWAKRAAARDAASYKSGGVTQQIDNVTIQIDGTTSPELVADAVAAKLSEIARTTVNNISRPE